MKLKATLQEFMKEVELEHRGSLWVAQFRAMASPCEVHLEVRSREQANHLAALAQSEALRIERLFSRYREDSIVQQINTANGRTITVDDETARLLNFANQCFELSEGLFDITSGLLREVWNFDGSDRVPDEQQVSALLPRIGWQKVRWEASRLSLPAGMQIDLGGIAKEYAVDRTVALLNEQFTGAFLVNYGGDLHALRAPESTGYWRVGVEASRASGLTCQTLQLQHGALTTSGDAQRYLLKNGIRYGHVLNPLTGWPASNSPSSVTVAGGTCTEAGILSTLAMLQGEQAEAFLEEQDVAFWVQR